MTDDPVDLDKRRGRAAQKETEIRRQSLQKFQADQAALRRSQEELEQLLLAAPAETWPEAAAGLSGMRAIASYLGEELARLEGTRRKTA